MTHSLQLIDQVDIANASRRSRRLLNRRALVGAAAGVVPLPGFDWAVDAALLSRLIPAINAEFGLTPEQLDRLTPKRREQVQKAVGLVGSALLGKLITKDLILKAAKLIGVRMASAQAAKFVPLAGQLASATMGYLAIRYFGEMHIKDCVQAVENSRSPIRQAP
ncbi:MAG: hypothetical protein ACKVIH_04995 [Burkholderiales bacterium]